MTEGVTIWYYLNHIVLMMVWGYFYNEYLPVSKTFRIDYRNLCIALWIMASLCLLIFKIPGTSSDNEVFRLLFTSLLLIFCVKIAKKASIKKTIIAVFFQLLFSLGAEIMVMLFTLLMNQFDANLYQNGFYMSFSAVIYLDIFTLFVFYIALFFLKKQRINLSSDYSVIVGLMFVSQFIWSYLLSYKLVYYKEPSFFLIVEAIVILLLSDLAIFLVVKKIIKWNKERIMAETEQNNNQELLKHFTVLTGKQFVLEEIFNELSFLDSQVNSLIDYHGQLKSIRDYLFCENPYVNALLNYYQNECDKKHIEFIVSIKSNLIEDADSYEINTILSNILKNALDSAEFCIQPYIQLQIVEKEGLLILRCINSICAKKKKTKKKISGQGLQIIQEIVKKQKGHYNLELKEDKAIIDIMMGK